MNGGQAFQPGTPSASPGDYWAQISAMVQQQLRAEAMHLQSEYRNQLDTEIKKICESLNKEAYRQVRPIVIGASTLILAVLSFVAYAQTRSLTQTSSGFYNSVIDLQGKVLATSTNLGEKVSLIAAANKELETTTHLMESTGKELQGLKDAVLHKQVFATSLCRSLDYQSLLANELKLRRLNYPFLDRQGNGRNLHTGLAQHEQKQPIFLPHE